LKEKEIYTNDVVTLDKIPYTKPIVVEFGGEIIGIVCKHKPNGIWNGTYRIQFIKGVQSEEKGLPQLVETWQKEGYTFKTQLEQGEPLQEIIADDSWIHINNDILHRDLVLVKKDGNIIGMVEFHNGDYFVCTGIDVWEQDLGYCSSKQSLIERGNE